MADILRLRNYRHYLDDGYGWVEYKHAEKDKVFVAILIGEEPKKVEEDNCLDVDSIILKMAEHIKKCRKERKKK